MDINTDVYEVPAQTNARVLGFNNSCLLVCFMCLFEESFIFVKIK